MDTNRIWRMIALLLMAGSLEARASESLPVAVAVQKALAYSPFLQAMKAGEAVADARIGEARAMKAPKVTLGVSDTRLDSPMLAFGARLNQGRIAAADFDPGRLNDPSAVNNLQIGAQVVLPIYLGGMDSHAVGAARQGLEAARLDTVRSTEDVVFRAIETYLNVVLARESVKVAEKACELSGESLRNAQDAVEAMRSVQSDLLQARVHNSENEESLLRMRNQHALALEGLATIMGVPSAAGFDLDMPFLDQECSLCQEDPRVLLDAALRQRPDFLKVARQKEASRHMERLSRGITRPRVVVGAAAEQNRDGLSGDGHGNSMVFARIDWNLADGGEAGSKARGARLQQDQLGRMEAALADQIHLEIREAITNINNALERIRVSREAVQQGEESLRILRDRYAAGLAIMSDLLGSETSLQSHRMSHLKALYDYSLSRARLKMALGELDQEHCDLLQPPVPGQTRDGGDEASSAPPASPGGS